MLNISPFTYGMTVTQIYDNGTTFHPSILDIEESTLLDYLMSGIRKIAALSLQLHYPTLASVPHSLINGFKNLLAISVATEYTFPASEQIKAYLADPSAFATAAPATTAAATESKEDTPAKEQEPEEESDEDMGLDLFG